jgi:hypothetical protein
MYLNKEQGHQLFIELLQGPMGELGFTLKGESFERKKRFGKEEISSDGLESRGMKKFVFTYNASKYIDPIENVWDEYWAEQQLAIGITLPPGAWPFSLCFNAKRISDYKFDPQNLRQWYRTYDYYESEATEEGVQQLVDQFLHNFRLYVIPTFDRFNNIQLLDAFANEQPEYYSEVIHILSAVGLHYKKMIIAKLAGNNDYELVCDAVKQLINKHFKDNEKARSTNYSIYERVCEKLKSVLPLANPVLD